jgi:hypothetical protein
LSPHKVHKYIKVYIRYIFYLMLNDLYFFRM